MATVILIVFLAVVAILGGWWLKVERKNQKNDLLRQGKLAAGKFDEIVMPKKKPKKRKRKKREGNFWDPKYVPPEIPDKHQLKDWLDQAESIINELMPRVFAYRAGKETHDPVAAALKAAEGQLVKSYNDEAITEAQALEWLDTLDRKLRDYNNFKAEYTASERQLRKLFTPAAESGLRLRSLISRANAWELYRAPEPFHEKLEMVTLLFESIRHELNLDNVQSAGNGSVRVLGEIGGGGGFRGNSDDWQGGRRSRRRSWDWRAEPEPEPVEDSEIVAGTRQKLVAALTHVAALAAAVDKCGNSQKKYREAGNHIKLEKPAKPTDQDVDVVLTEAYTWATSYQMAKGQLWNDSLAYRKAMQSVQDILPALKEAVESLKDALVVDQDNFARDVLVRAFEQIAKFIESVPDQVKTATSMTMPYAIGKEEAQSDKDAATNLRNLMRKAGFAMAQAETAKANHEAGKGEHVSLAETVPPVLTQSSASAFVNAHTRMTEISARNSQKTEAHNIKVKQLSQQQTEREQQAVQAVRAVATALNGLGHKRDGWSANLERMHATATLFCAVFNK